MAASSFVNAVPSSGAAMATASLTGSEIGNGAQQQQHEKHPSMSSTSGTSFVMSPMSPPPPPSFNVSTHALKSLDSGLVSPACAMNQLQPNSPTTQGTDEQTTDDTSSVLGDQKGRLMEHEKTIEYGGPNNRYGKTTKSEYNELSQEIEILTKVRHPNVINFHDSWYNDGEFIFITELMTSGTLREYITKFKNPGIKIIKRWARQILKGLAHLHSHNPPIIHRDIKCDNIFVNGSHGEIKIGDMGTAKMKFGKKYTVIGTPEFMAPEMYEEKGYSEKVDIYAFGMCLLEMATGEYPYSECKNAAQIYKKVTQGIRPECLAKVEDKELLSIINICLSPDNDRWSARKLLDYFFAEDPEVVLLSSDEQKTKLSLQIDEGILSAKYQIHLTNEIYRIVREIAKPSPPETSHQASSSSKEHLPEEQARLESRPLSVRPVMTAPRVDQQLATHLNRMSIDSNAAPPGLEFGALSPVAQAQCLVKEYSDVVAIEEFVSDVAIMTNRGLDKASEWLSKLKREDIDTVGDLRKLQDEDWNRLSLSVFACRAFKNALKVTPPTITGTSGSTKINASLLLANLSPRMTGRVPNNEE